VYVLQLGTQRHIQLSQPNPTVLVVSYRCLFAKIACLLFKIEGLQR
jgi:hypothetical protein